MGLIDDAFTELHRYHWSDAISSSLSGLHRTCGSPERVINSFNRDLKTLPFITFEKIGPLAGYEKDAVIAFNDVVKLAYSCIGWEFIGLCSAIAYGAPRTKRPWDEYVEKGEVCLANYFLTDEAFDDFEAYILMPARGMISPSR